MPLFLTLNALTEKQAALLAEKLLHLFSYEVHCCYQGDPTRIWTHRLKAEILSHAPLSGGQDATCCSVWEVCSVETEDDGQRVYSRERWTQRFTIWCHAFMAMQA